MSGYPVDFTGDAIVVGLYAVASAGFYLDPRAPRECPYCKRSVQARNQFRHRMSPTHRLRMLRTLKRQRNA